MDKLKIIINSYNNVLKESYENYFGDEKELDENWEKEFEAILEDNIEKWEAAPVKELGNISAGCFFGAVNDFGLITRYFIEAAHLSDEGLPPSLTGCLLSFGKKAKAFLTGLLTDNCMSSDENHEVLLAIRTLGKFNCAHCLNCLTDALKKTCNIQIKEEIKDALVDMGKACMDYLIKYLMEADTIDDDEEYILVAVSEIGRDNKNDNAYSALKDSFKRMENKIIGAICLGTYGDGRAIPVLRGYMEKNVDSMDRETFYEIKCQVQRLGGKTDDIIFQ